MVMVRARTRVRRDGEGDKSKTMKLCGAVRCCVIKCVCARSSRWSTEEVVRVRVGLDWTGTGLPR